MIARYSLPLTLAILVAAGCQPSQPTLNQPPVTPSPSGSADPGTSPSAGPSNAPSAGATLRGRVYDEDLNPLAGVTLSVQAAAGAPLTATTGADGTYTLAVPAGQVTVTATKGGFTTRAQKATVSGDTVLDFGGLEEKPSNAFFLSTNPEIDNVTVEEAKPGGPMTLKVHFSEPITQASQTNFMSRLWVETRAGEDFLRATGDIDPKLVVDTTWDAAGQLFTMVYDEPYLPSGPTDVVNYNLRMEQVQKTSIDPVTDEREWESLRVTDAENNPLGKDRADFIFLKPDLQVIGSNELINRAWGYSPSIRRWNLTHTSTFNFSAAKDTVGPGLESVKVEGKVTIGGNEYDLVTMRFTEPMRVVRQYNELEYTRLDPDKDKEMLIINVSKNADGSSPQPLGSSFRVESFRFSKTDPNIVIARYPSGSFRDMVWAEVTLGKDLRDPAGNKADPAKMTIAGEVSNVEVDE